MNGREHNSLFWRTVDLYVDGFRSMTLGRTLWLIILIKLFIMFAILRIFFFPDALAGKSDDERSAIVGNSLIDNRADYNTQTNTKQ